jgi:phage terminase small subunit
VKSLTELERRFADLYLETGNATQSYIDAGYKASSRAVADANARKLLAKPKIKVFIDERIAAKDEARVAKQDEILQFLTAVMRGEKTEQIPIGLGMGEQKLAQKELDGKERIKAAELLGKRYGMWVDRQQIDANVGVQIIDDIGSGQYGGG